MTVGVFAVTLAAALALVLGWLAVEFTVDLAGTFEVIAEIVGWILLPLGV